MKKNKNEILEELYRAHHETLYRYALAQVGDEHTADDLTEDAFLYVYDRLDYLPTVQEEKLVQQLYRAVQRGSERDLKLREQIRPMFLGEDAAYTATGGPVGTIGGSAYDERGLQKMFDRDYMEKLIRNLYGDEREAVMLYYVERRTAQEAAAQMEISLDSFYKKKERGIKRLRWFAKHITG